MAEHRRAPLADELEWDVPSVLAAVVIDQPHHVHRRQLLDRELGNLLLPAVALGHFRGVHEEDQAALALDLERFDVAIDGQRLLDRRALPAAGAETVRTADHDETAALLVGVAADD